MVFIFILIYSGWRDTENQQFDISGINSPFERAFENPREVADKLNKEVLSRRIIGPFDTPPLRIFEVPLLAWFLKKLLGNSVSYITCPFPKSLL